MTQTNPATPNTRVARLRAQLAIPFIQNAYSLVGSTLATTGLGAVFWFVATRTTTTAEFGRAAALISTMLFLSSISQLNLTNGFNRFVPVAGNRTRRFVAVGYLAATTTALLAATVFVIGIDVWAPRLSLLHDNWIYGLWFVLGTVVWTVFALQDAVLTGLGEARWVLIENVIYGVVKIGLLFVAVAALPALGVYAAWTMPLVVIVVAINWLIFERIVPKLSHPPLESVTAKTVRHYVGFDMVATWTFSATIGLMPLIMLSILGPSASGYLYVSWTIAYTLYLISIGVGMSFVTETSKAPERIVEFARKMIAHSLRIVAPLALVIVVAAPLALRLYGPAYSNHATRLLQLLALSAIPNAVTATYLSITRVQRRLKAVIVTTGALSAGVFVISISLAPVIGIAAVGVGWLVSQTVVASALLLGELRTVWLPYVHTDRLHTVTARRRAARRRRGATVTARVLDTTGLGREGWEIVESVEETEAVSVVVVRNPARDGEALLKLANNAYGVAALGRETDALAQVWDAASPHLRSVLPQPLDAGSHSSTWTLDTRCPGVNARVTVGDEVQREVVITDLVARMASLYRATATSVQISEGLPELLELPSVATGSLPTSKIRVRADATSLERLQTELRDELAGKTVTAARLHGNLWLGNVLCSTADGRVTGIVNWERSRIDVPAIEVMHLVCTTRGLVEQRELGAVVRDVLAVGALRDDEAALVESVPGFGELPVRTAVLLMWLRHVHGYALRSEGTRPSDVWLSHNVHQVLESV